MIQVLVVIAGHQLPQGPLSFLHAMQENDRVHAKGLFFFPADVSALAAASAGNNIVPIMQLEDSEKETMANNKTLFARKCEQHFIPFTIHENDKAWDRNLLIKESRFADLILISGELFYAGIHQSQPNQYLHQVLHNAECPVLVVPENFSSIRQVLMAYDGSPESLYAIKQFCYLFPALIDLPTEVIYVSENAGIPIPDIERIKQFTRLKLDAMSFDNLTFNASECFSTWISEKKDVLLVSGSFSRSAFSYLAKRSFTADMIRDHKMPVFIAHR
jgi:hypothetical protein